MVNDLLNLPIEQKIGQLFFIGLSGAEIDADTKELLKNISPGGVCLFARNIRQTSQTRQLLDDIRENLLIEPLLSLDQEGGLVDRLRRIISPMPAANSLKSPSEAKRLAQITAETIRILGFNTNFAPVIDVIDEQRANSFNGLYSRAFGKSHNEVIEYATEYLDGLQNDGCLGCLKHFPGLGASQVDSHEDLPNVYLTREELVEMDLLPYQRIISSGNVQMVMVGHATYPRFDLQETDNNGKLLPSSMSYNIVSKLLRDELKFDKLVVTDDLEMGAIVKNYGIGDACVLAFNAGIDMLTICSEPQLLREGYNAVLNAFKTEKISESRIDESLRRIAQVKNLIQPPLSFDESRLQNLSKEITQLNNYITEDKRFA